MVSAARIVEVVFEKFGLVGGVFALIYAFVLKYASLEQKRQLIDKYLLGEGVEECYFLIAIIVALVLLFIFQYTIYKKKLKTVEREMKRVSAERTSLQEQLIGSLHHDDNK